MLHEPDRVDQDRRITNPAARPGAVPPADILNPPAKRSVGWCRWIATWTVLTISIAFVAAVIWLAIAAPPSRTARPIVLPSVTLLASNGSAISRTGALTDAPIDVRALPDHVGNAFVAIEDRRFYRHHGLDPRGIARAAWHDLRDGQAREGGSTITQQLAKLVYLNSDRTAGRKVREALIAVWLEAWLSKDQILSRYLSDAYFGDNVYGLRAAARHYFSKPPERLTIGEAALLAGLMKAPSRLAPSSNPAGARARASLVTTAMWKAGFIGRAEADAASAQLRLRPASEPKRATYFSDWVLPSVPTDPDDAYAPISMRTTLDARLQRLAVAAISQVHLPAAQVALVAMRPDGRVVAMVGGRNYRTSSFNRATQAKRQPGSTFKLFVYLAALRAGMSPDDIVEDRPLTVAGWSPRNSDGRYLGDISLREAFARSSNVAAVRLAQRVGPAAVARAATDLGIVSPLPMDAGIALGTSGTTLLELAGAYASVADGRYPTRPCGLLEQGAQQAGRRPLDDRERAQLLDLLAAAVNEGTARGAGLTTQVYGKTGTSQDNRDAVFVGFAGGLVTAVWIGRDDNRPLPGVAGGGAPAHVWRTFMAGAIGARPAQAHAPRSVDPDDGLDGMIRKMVEHLKERLHF